MDKLKKIFLPCYQVAKRIKKKIRPGMVVPTCNSSYLGGGNWEDQGLREG
jgi:hypothetical protein